MKGKIIQIYNYGNCCWDFTYEDDVEEGIVSVMAHVFECNGGEDGLPTPAYKICNMSEGHPEKLLDFVQFLQEE